MRLLQMPAPITMRQFSARLTQLTLTWSAHSLAGLVDETVAERDEARARVAELEAELERTTLERDHTLEVILERDEQLAELREEVAVAGLAAAEIGLHGDVADADQRRAWTEARQHRAAQRAEGRDEG